MLSFYRRAMIRIRGRTFPDNAEFFYFVSQIFFIFHSNRLGIVLFLILDIKSSLIITLHV